MFRGYIVEWGCSGGGGNSNSNISHRRLSPPPPTHTSCYLASATCDCNRFTLHKLTKLKRDGSRKNSGLGILRGRFEDGIVLILFLSKLWEKIMFGIQKKSIIMI